MADLDNIKTFEVFPNPLDEKTYADVWTVDKLLLCIGQVIFLKFWMQLTLFPVLTSIRTVREAPPEYEILIAESCAQASFRFFKNNLGLLIFFYQRELWRISNG